MTQEQRQALEAKDRIPDIDTAMRCVKSLLKYHRFNDEEHMYRDDLRVAIRRIEQALDQAPETVTVDVARQTIERKIVELTELCGVFPEQSKGVNPRAWTHLCTYRTFDDSDVQIIEAQND